MESLTATTDIDAASGAATVVLDGVLHDATSGVLALKVAVALATEPDRLRIDLSGVTSCDSQGLRTLVGAYELCKRDGVTCEAIGASDFLAKLFSAEGHSETVRTPAAIEAGYPR